MRRRGLILATCAAIASGAAPAEAQLTYRSNRPPLEVQPAARTAYEATSVRVPRRRVRDAAPSGAGVEAEVRGDLIVRYEDPQFSHPNFNPAGDPDDLGGLATWNMVQADLILSGRVGEHSRFHVRSTFPGGAAAGAGNRLTEAWISNDALGPGTLTLGRFFRPRGAPLPVLNLSMPALVFHTFPVVGGKYHVDLPGRLRVEGGVTNSNPISLVSSEIGDAPLFGRPFQGTFTSNPAEVYGHLGRTDAGSWGSIDLGITYTHGRLSAADVATLRTSGMFRRNSADRTRQIWDVSADYIYGPVHVFGEFVTANEGDLEHEVWEAGVSVRLLKTFSVTGSYGRYRLNADNVTFALPASWNRKRTTFGAIWEVRPGLQVQGEYEVHEENARDPIGREIFNDRGTVQVLTYF